MTSLNILSYMQNFKFLWITRLLHYPSPSKKEYKKEIATTLFKNANVADNNRIIISFKGKFLELRIPQTRLRLKTQEWLSATFILTSAKKYLSTFMDVQLKVVINDLFSLYKSLHLLCSSVGFLCSTFYFLLCILFLPLVLI